MAEVQRVNRNSAQEMSRRGRSDNPVRDLTGRRCPLAKTLNDGPGAGFLRTLGIQAIVVFTDYPNRSRTRTADELFPELDAEAMQLLQRRSAILIVDHSREGPKHDGRFSALLHEWADLHGIPRRSVVHSTTNHASPGQQAAWAGLEQDQHSWLYFNTFVDDVARGALEELDDSVVTSLLDDQRERDFRFLCLNGVARPHRLLLVAHLLNDEQQDALVSLGGTKGSNQNVSGFVQAAQNYRTGTMAAKHDHLFDDLSYDALVEKVNLRPPAGSLEAGVLPSRLDTHLYQSTSISVVTETEMTAGHIDRITEKSVKPLLFGHLSVVAGNPGALRRVRALGFQTFHPFIDESYDEIDDPSERLCAVLGEIDRLRHLSDVEFGRLLAATKEVRMANLIHGHKELLPATRERLAHDVARISNSIG